MSIKTNPSIVTNGLVFNYDASSTSSYTGPPIRNIATQISQSYANNASALFKITNGTEVVNIPTLGKVTSKYVDVYNDYAGGSTECCPSLFNYGTDLATNASTLHTYAIVYKSVNGYTNANYLYRYEYNGATYVLEAGIFNTSNRIHLGDDWYWAWGTFTTNASTTRFNSISLFMYEYLKYNRIYVAKVLMCQGDYSTLHPRHWPEVNTTKSNTQSLLDPVGRNTITANSVTYASNGVFSFNGSTNFISAPNTNLIHRTTDFAYSCWVNFAGISGSGTIFENGSWTSCLLIRHETSYFTIYSMSSLWGTFAFTPTIGTWYKLDFVRNGSLLNFYVNGVYQAQMAFTADVNPSSNLYIGMSQHAAGQCFNGRIDQVAIYNRALAIAEIQQNFNALRGRYGV